MTDRIRLNVGGARFETTLTTLCRFHESMLATMFRFGGVLGFKKRRKRKKGVMSSLVSLLCVIPCARFNMTEYVRLQRSKMERYPELVAMRDQGTEADVYGYLDHEIKKGTLQLRQKVALCVVRAEVEKCAP